MRRTAGWLTALVASFALGACAQIPHSGPVESTSQVDTNAADAPRYAPAGPPADATPEQIVRGYLDAMLAYPVSSGVAARFLTPDARRTWQSDHGTAVYSGQSFTYTVAPSDVESSSLGESVVRLRATRQATLDAQGRYTGSTEPLDRRFRLAQVQGQWRIVNPPSGTLVTAKFFQDYYRPYSLWFFDRPGRRLVPEVVHLVAGERLATSLATSLAAGPAADGALRTYLRSQDGLRPSVPVSDDGVADVELADEVASRSPGDRDRILAQFVQTLRQVPDVRSIRVSAGTTRLTPADTGGTELSARFEPPGAGPRVYAVVRRTLREVTPSGLEKVSGAWGKRAQGVSAVAVGGQGVAAVQADGSGVVTTDRLGATTRTYATSGRTLVTWDTAGLLWIVDRPDGQTRVRVVRDGTIVPVATTLGGLDVTSFSVSPDGGHFAVTDGDSGVRVGSVERGATEDAVRRLLAPERVVRSAPSPSAVRWFDPTHVGYLAQTQVGVQVHQAAIDGSDRAGGVSGAEPLLPEVGATRLAIGAGVDPPLWVVDGRGRLWYRPVGQSWLIVDAGPVTSLSSSP